MIHGLELLLRCETKLEPSVRAASLQRALP